MDTKDGTLRGLVESKYPSVEAFAKAAGVGRTTVYRLFEGEMGSVIVARKVADALGITVAQVVEFAVKAEAEKGVAP